MLDPNTFMMARVIYERRVVEALRAQQYRPLRRPQVNWLTRLLFKLGKHLVNLGKQLKTESVAPPAEPAVG